MTRTNRSRKQCANCNHIYYSYGGGYSIVKHCAKCARQFSDSEMEYLIEKCYKNE